VNELDKYTHDDFPQADNLEQELVLVDLDESTTQAVESPHRHNYFELFFFEQGGGSHTIDFSELPVRHFSIHMVLPGSLHLLKRDKNSKGTLIVFTRSFLYSLQDFNPSNHIRLWQKQPSFMLSQEEAGFVKVCLSQMADELKQKRLGQYRVLSSLLRMLFILLMRQMPSENVYSAKLVDRFLALVESEYKSAKGAGWYAEALHCGINKLNQQLRAADLNSAQNIITERKVLEAKRILMHTDWSAKEVSYYLGYNDPDYFGRVFKKHTGQTASNFIAKNRHG
jgi:AraC family transcriptional activator of pobA